MIEEYHVFLKRNANQDGNVPSYILNGVPDPEFPNILQAKRPFDSEEEAVRWMEVKHPGQSFLIIKGYRT